MPMAPWLFRAAGRSAPAAGGRCPKPAVVGGQLRQAVVNTERNLLTRGPGPWEMALDAGIQRGALAAGRNFAELRGNGQAAPLVTPLRGLRWINEEDRLPMTLTSASA